MERCICRQHYHHCLLKRCSANLHNGFHDQNVINLSLGGPDASTTAQVLYDQIRSENKLLVAAAGNDGTQEKFYPATYDSVISVGAVDEANDRAGG